MNRNRWLVVFYITVNIVLFHVFYKTSVTDLKSVMNLRDEFNANQLAMQILKGQMNEMNKTSPPDTSIEINNGSNETPFIYVITPTYSRLTQQPDLTRFTQTLTSVSNLHWIVIEDSKEKTPFVLDLISRVQFPVAHLNVQKSAEEKRAGTRGCTQRNAALEWIIKQNITRGVLYFADDDNAYDIRVFDELRTTDKIGLVPTGNLAKTGVSTPVVKDAHVIDYLDVWPGGRKWPIEMASLGVNIHFWRSRGSPRFEPTKKGFAETQFLEAMNITYADLEPKANNCTAILVWHTNTVEVKINKVITNSEKYSNTNIPLLAKYLIFANKN